MARTKRKGQKKVQAQNEGTEKNDAQSAEKRDHQAEADGGVKDKPQPAQTLGKETSGADEITAIFKNAKKKKESDSKVEPEEEGGGKGSPGKEKGSKRNRTSEELGPDLGASKKGKNKKGDSAPRPRKKTEEGFAVYSADDLGWNKKSAGGTPLCPFDCECCF